MGFVTCKPLHMYDPKYGMAMRKKGFLVKCCNGVVSNFTFGLPEKDIAHHCVTIAHYLILLWQAMDVGHVFHLYKPLVQVN